MDNALTLTTERVDKLFKECLFASRDWKSDEMVVEGITTSFALNRARVKENIDEIKFLVNELPPSFAKSGGGGFTFLNMCMDKRGNQWTGWHSSQEFLLVLGIAAGLMEYAMPRKYWDILPGGVPYVTVNL